MNVPSKGDRSSAPTELLLVRHAEAWCNVEDTLGGPLTCRGLTAQGHRQAQTLAARLHAQYGGTDQVDCLYVSPRTRAVQTAQPVSAALGLPLHIVDGLREQDFGEADGAPRASLHAAVEGNPVLHPGHVPAPGAESWAAYTARTADALTTLVNAHPGCRILVIAHGETVNAAHHHFLGLPPDWPGPLPLSVDNTSLTCWREESWYRYRPALGRRWVLFRHNDTSRPALEAGSRSPSPTTFPSTADESG